VPSSLDPREANIIWKRPLLVLYALGLKVFLKVALNRIRGGRLRFSILVDRTCGDWWLQWNIVCYFWPAVAFVSIRGARSWILQGVGTFESDTVKKQNEGWVTRSRGGMWSHCSVWRPQPTDIVHQLCINNKGIQALTTFANYSLGPYLVDVELLTVGLCWCRHFRHQCWTFTFHTIDQTQPMPLMFRLWVRVRNSEHFWLYIMPQRERMVYQWSCRWLTFSCHLIFGFTSRPFSPRPNFGVQGIAAKKNDGTTRRATFQSL
jgi:hypothetical protein